MPERSAAPGRTMPSTAERPTASSAERTTGSTAGRPPLRRVGQVADLAGITVRTLHHWDEIGLLEPAARSDAGYRLYSEDDLERLYRILLYRELDLSLEAIADLLDDPGTRRRRVLREQRQILEHKLQRTEGLLRAVDRMLDTIDQGGTMSSEEIFEGLEAFSNAPPDVRAQQAKHGSEAAERWGDTPAYQESLRRARSYSTGDWERIKVEGEAAEAGMAELLQGGADPEGEDAMEGAEAMRLHIDRWFYPCSHGMHASLAGMYESDPRFEAHYEDRAEGLAAFVAEAIRANARRATAGS